MAFDPGNGLIGGFVQLRKPLMVSRTMVALVWGMQA